MTKFEEEAIKEAEKCGYVMAKSKIVFYEDEKGITFVDFNGTHTNFNFPWLEFAKNWHSDEEFQELKEQHGNQAESILLMLEEIDSLKSQLQQQALPVVPEFVAEWIEILKTKGLKPLKNPETYGETGFTEEKLQNIVFWISERQEDYMRAWLDGYTVEKPQLFRVCLLDGRHTLTRRDPRKTLPFNYTFLWSYSSELKEMREINRKVDLFTEEEIKSIDERYWQFAVPVEDNK